MNDSIVLQEYFQLIISKLNTDINDILFQKLLIVFKNTISFQSKDMKISYVCPLNVRTSKYILQGSKV